MGNGQAPVVSSCRHSAYWYRFFRDWPYVGKKHPPRSRRSRHSLSIWRSWSPWWNKNTFRLVHNRSGSDLSCTSISSHQLSLWLQPIAWLSSPWSRHPIPAKKTFGTRPSVHSHLPMTQDNKMELKILERTTRHTGKRHKAGLMLRNPSINIPDNRDVLRHSTPGSEIKR